MIDSRTAPYAALLLRVSLGLLFLAHAGLKFFVFTPAGTAKFFDSVGLPPALAYVTIAVEVLGAIFTVHGAAGFFFTNPHGGWEFPAFWSVALIVQALLGDGAYALRVSSDNPVGKLTGAHSH